MPFNMFPYSNLHELNADWVLQQVKESAEDAQEAAQAAQEAAQTAEGMQDQIDSLDSRMDSYEGSLDDVVKYTSQSEDSTRQARARLNIGAASQADMTIAQHDIQDKVDINQGHMVDPRIYSSSPGSTTGAALIAVPPNSVALQPVTNGNVDGSSYAKLMVATPTGNNDAATKKYVDDQDALKLPKSTPEADLSLKITGTANDNPAIILEGPSSAVNLVYDETTHSLGISGQQEAVPHNFSPALRGLANPTDPSDAVNKAYLDANLPQVVNVTGANPTISPENNHIYICGELETLTISSSPATGIWSVIFTSGAAGSETTVAMTADVVMPDLILQPTPDMRSMCIETMGCSPDGM